MYGLTNSSPTHDHAPYLQTLSCIVLLANTPGPEWIHKRTPRLSDSPHACSSTSALSLSFCWQQRTSIQKADQSVITTVASERISNTRPLLRGKVQKKTIGSGEKEILIQPQFVWREGKKKRLGRAVGNTANIEVGGHMCGKKKSFTAKLFAPIASISYIPHIAPRCDYTSYISIQQAAP